MIHRNPPIDGHGHNIEFYTPSMEQDEQVIAMARRIYTQWMSDDRWRKAHLHPPQAPQDYPIAYFWAELAAKAALRNP